MMSLREEGDHRDRSLLGEWADETEVTLHQEGLVSGGHPDFHTGHQRVEVVIGDARRVAISVMRMPRLQRSP